MSTCFLCGEKGHKANRALGIDSRPLTRCIGPIWHLLDQFNFFGRKAVPGLEAAPLLYAVRFGKLGLCLQSQRSDGAFFHQECAPASAIDAAPGQPVALRTDVRIGHLHGFYNKWQPKPKPDPLPASNAHPAQLFAMQLPPEDLHRVFEAAGVFVPTSAVSLGPVSLEPVQQQEQAGVQQLPQLPDPLPEEVRVWLEQEVLSWRFTFIAREVVAYQLCPACFRAHMGPGQRLEFENMPGGSMLGGCKLASCKLLTSGRLPCSIQWHEHQ